MMKLWDLSTIREKDFSIFQMSPSCTRRNDSFKNFTISLKNFSNLKASIFSARRYLKNKEKIIIICLKTYRVCKEMNLLASKHAPSISFLSFFCISFISRFFLHMTPSPFLPSQCQPQPRHFAASIADCENCLTQPFSAIRSKAIHGIGIDKFWKKSSILVSLW